MLQDIYKGICKFKYVFIFFIIVDFTARCVKLQYIKNIIVNLVPSLLSVELIAVPCGFAPYNVLNYSAVTEYCLNSDRITCIQYMCAIPLPALFRPLFSEHFLGPCSNNHNQRYDSHNPSILLGHLLPIIQFNNLFNVEVKSCTHSS